MILVLRILLGVCMAAIPLMYVLYCWHGNAWNRYDKAKAWNKYDKAGKEERQ